ncbi:uncharacterized protein with LGFP repeats/GH25 family lysozyme M1 (1,4-beta-N-acetylmuramidase) [Arthrobacter sp. CAN_A6]|uniref:GH25 family lysozyme n=1 Tax=Arthrobacter sp. CAN_A6 TaxID=2787721 RepID=UPI0018C8FB78
MKSSNTLRLARRSALLASLLVGLTAPVAAVANTVESQQSSESVPSGTQGALPTATPEPSAEAAPMPPQAVPEVSATEVPAPTPAEVPAAEAPKPGTPALSAEDELKQRLQGATLGQGLARIAEHGDPQVPTSEEQGLWATAKAGAGAALDSPDTDSFAAATNFWTPTGVLGVDVSSYQGAVDWTGAWNYGSRFAYVKATENTNYLNPFFTQQYAGAGSAGMLRGAYHFATPSLSDGKTQAEYFVKNGGGWSADGKTLPPLLDVEYNPYPSLGNSCYNMTASQMVTWIRDFSDRMVQLTGRVPMIYTTADWWNTCTGSSRAFSDHPLHLARYSNSTAGTMPSGWSNYSLWQYTDSGPVVGDWNQWRGDLASLRDFARNGPSVSVPPSREAVAKPFIDGAAAAVPALGTPVSDVICGLKDNGCYRGYVNGAVLWSAGSGAAATLNGPLRKAWLDSGAQNGPMGYPVSAQGCGIRDGGCYQSFQGGEILYSAASGAHLSRNGEIRSAYRAAGAESSILGYPTNGEICGIKDGGCYQTFQHGEVLWSPASGARISYNSAIRTAYRAAGAENGILGYPISGEICGIRDGGCYQAYQGGEVLWSAGSGAHLTRQGGIRLAYRAAGAENSILGYPTGAETCGLRNGGCYQAYQRGEILWSPTTSTQITHHGAIRTAYRAAGAESSILGYPTNREICGIKDGGCYQSFQNGEIFWSAASGAHLSRGGGIRLAYRAAGAENGILGYPTNTEICGIRDGGCYQSFQRGEILWSPKTGPVITRNGGIRNTYRTQGAENGALGYPTNTEICGIRDGGCYQSFQNGEILWSPRTEAHSTITGPIRTTYRAQGAENGALGYPTKTQTCTTNTQCTQPFQNGTLTWTPTNGVRMVRQ